MINNGSYFYILNTSGQASSSKENNFPKTTSKVIENFTSQQLPTEETPKTFKNKITEFSEETIKNSNNSKTSLSEEKNPLKTTSKGTETSNSMTETSKKFENEITKFSEKTLKKPKNSKTSISETKDYIKTLKHQKAIKFLSPCNLLFLDIQKNLLDLSHDIKFIIKKDVFIHNGRTEILSKIQDISIIIHQILREIRNYSKLINGVLENRKNKHFIKQAKDRLSELNVKLTQFNSIETSYISKKLVYQLNENINHLFNILLNSELLDEAVNSLCPNEPLERSCLLYPPISPYHMEVFRNSLKNTLKSFDLYQQLIESEIKIPIRECLNFMNKSTLLENLSSALQGYLISLDLIDNIMFRPVENATKNTLKDPALEKIETVLTSVNFIDACEEVVSLGKQLFSYWKPVDSQNKGNQEIALGFIKTQAERVAKALQQVQDRNIQNRLPNKLRKKLNSKTKFLNELAEKRQHYTIIINFFDEPMRLPLSISCNMDFFCILLKEFQERAQTLQNSLNCKGNVSCSAFKVIDFLFHKLFYQSANIELKQLSPWQEVAHEIFSTLYLQILSLKNNETKVLVPDHAQFAPLLDIKVCLKQLCKINNSLNDEIPEEVEIKNILIDLENYLDCLPDIGFPLIHLQSLLENPINHNDALVTCDLPVVKHHYALFNTDKEIEEDLEKIKKACRQKLQHSPAAGKHFWELNMACISAWSLSTKKTLDILRNYKKVIIECESAEEMIKRLHELEKKLSLWDLNKYDLQLSILYKIAKKEEIKALYKPLKAVSLIIAWNISIKMALVDIVESNSLSEHKSSSIKNMSSKRKPLAQLRINAPVPTELESDESDESDPIPETVNDIPHQSFTYKATSFEENLELLNRIDRLTITPLKNESYTSFGQRQLDRRSLIKNSAIYLQAIGEKDSWKQNIPNNLLCRSEFDSFLLLESTMKMGLIGEKIAAQENRSTHLFYEDSSRKLLYTHNGETLILGIQQVSKKWLSEAETRPLIQALENNLKRSFWFEKKMVSSNTEALSENCKKVWLELASKPEFNKHKYGAIFSEAEKYIFFKTNKFKAKRDFEINLHKFTNSAITATTFLEKFEHLESQLTPNFLCRNFFKKYVKAIREAITLAASLETSLIMENTPVLTAMRSSEIQVSLLSSIMKLALTMYNPAEDEVHPLLQAEGNSARSRPLALSHNVNNLWDTVCDRLSLELDSQTEEKFQSCLPLFLGDPRYPYPNKTPLTDDLVQIHKKSLLVKKLEQNHFFNKKENFRLAKYIGAPNKQASKNKKIALLEKELHRDLEKQKMKMNIALDLAIKILELL